MIKRMSIILFLPLLIRGLIIATIAQLLTGHASLAETIHIAQTTQGSDTGADAANAHSITWANTAGNNANPKVAGKIGPGDMVIANGTFTTAFSGQINGNNGSLITLQLASGAKFSKPHWGTGGAIYLGAKNYWVLDGGVNGIVEDTDNGSGLGTSADGYGILLEAPSHIVVKNFTVQNIYKRTDSADTSGFAAWAIAVRGTANNFSDIIITNNVIHDAATGIIMEYASGCSDFGVFGNTIYNVNHGIAAPDRTSSSSLTRLVIGNNIVYHWTTWDNPGPNAFHHNGVYCWSVQGGTSVLSDVTLFGNQLGPGYGNAFQTSGMYFEGNVQNVTVYNGLWKCGAGEYAANGMIAWGATATTPHLDVIGCTFIMDNIGVGISVGAAGTRTATIKNNLGIGNGGTSMFIAIYNSGSITTTPDYNLGYNFSATQPYSYSVNSSINPKTFSQWQALGFDAHGVTSDPNLDSNYIPQSGSPAIAGVLLGSPFNIDAANLSRGNPSTMGWKEWVGAVSPPVVIKGRLRGAVHLRVAGP